MKKPDPVCRLLGGDSSDGIRRFVSGSSCPDPASSIDQAEAPLATSIGWGYILFRIILVSVYTYM